MRSPVASSSRSITSALSAWPSVGAQPDAAPAISDEAIISPTVPSSRNSSRPKPIPESAHRAHPERALVEALAEPHPDRHREQRGHRVAEQHLRDQVGLAQHVADHERNQHADPADPELLDPVDEQQHARVAVAPHVARGAPRAHRTAAGVVGALARQRRDRPQDRQRGEHGGAAREQAEPLARRGEIFEQRRAEPERREQAERAHELARGEYAHAVAAVLGELRAERHVRNFEQRVRGVEAEHRDGDPRHERVAGERRPAAPTRPRRTPAAPGTRRAASSCGDPAATRVRSDQ